MYKITPLKYAWGDLGHVEIYKKIEFFLTFDYAVLFKMKI
jgi:hypothetical protein